MAYSVFVSHSIAAADRSALRDICDQLARFGIECCLPRRDAGCGAPLAAGTEEAIRASDCVIAFLTKDGSEIICVDQEIGAARDMQKQIIPIAEKGANLEGLQARLRHIELDRHAPADAARKLAIRLSRLHSSREVAEIIFWAVLAMWGRFMLNSSGEQA